MFDWDEVREKLKILRDRDPHLEAAGAKKHRYQSIPVSEMELLEFENVSGFPLPNDYREFLKQIGYGVGPDYGLLSPQEALDETFSLIFEEEDYCAWTPEDHGYGRLLHFEDFKQKHVDLLVQKRNQGEYKEPSDIAPHLLCCLKGSVIISDVGSGIYNVLLGKAEMAGTVWSIMAGELPVYPEGISLWPPEKKEWREDESHIWNFETWYMRWLNSGIEHGLLNLKDLSRVGIKKPRPIFSNIGWLQKGLAWVRRRLGRL